MAINSASHGLRFNLVKKVGLTLLLLCLINHSNVLQASPIFANEYNEDVTVETSTNHSADNTTNNDLYVIRAVVYEIGVLTDADNSTDNSTEIHEKVDLSFYDPPHNDDGLLNLDKASPSNVILNDSENYTDMSKENVINV